MVYVLYGQPGSGKTTISQLLYTYVQHQSTCDPVIIDGDEFRKIFKQTDYSPKGRENNIRAANTVATYISTVNNADVILALVNPYKHLRDELRANNSQVIEIYLETERDLRKGYHVKDFEIGDPDIRINTDKNEHASWLDLQSELNNIV